MAFMLVASTPATPAAVPGRRSPLASRILSTPSTRGRSTSPRPGVIDNDGIEAISAALADNKGLVELTLFKNREPGERAL